MTELKTSFKFTDSELLTILAALNTQGRQMAQCGAGWDNPFTALGNKLAACEKVQDALKAEVERRLHNEFV